MKIEHVALNVSEPTAMASWYEKTLGLTIVSRLKDPPYTHFLADDGGTVMLEIYLNPADQVPEYANMDPLLLHLAFVSTAPEADKEKALQAGASLVQDILPPDGSHIVMMRDPWGLAFQFCRRTTPLLPGRP